MYNFTVAQAWNILDMCSGRSVASDLMGAEDDVREQFMDIVSEAAQTIIMHQGQFMHDLSELKLALSFIALSNKMARNESLFKEVAIQCWNVLDLYQNDDSGYGHLQEDYIL